LRNEKIREEIGMSIYNIPDELERRHGIKLSYGSVNRVLKKGVAPLKRERKTRNKEEKKIIKTFFNKNIIIL